MKSIKKKILLLTYYNTLNMAILSMLLDTIENQHIRRYWVKPYLYPQLRDIYGAFNHLFVYFALNDQEEFYHFTRMSLDNFITLYRLVAPRLMKFSRRQPISPDVRLAIVLHYLAHGGSARNQAWLFRIGRATIYKLVSEVCHIISAVLIPIYIKFPNKQQWLKIAEGFEKDWNFPNCIGALDGMHVNIQKPPHAGAIFKNYKKFHSMVLMATCDHKKRFTWFTFGDYGSYSDSSIFGTTNLSMKIQNNTADIPPPRILPNSNITTTFVFVADEIFGLSSHVMKPYSQRKNLTMQEKIFYYRLSRARLTIECCFGLLKTKWKILESQLKFKVESTEKIVAANIALHNFLLYENDAEEMKFVQEDYNAPQEMKNATFPVIIRNRFKTYFSSPEGSVEWQENYI